MSADLTTNLPELAERLIEQGLLSPDDARRAMAALRERDGHDRLSDILVELRLADEHAVRRAEAELLCLPMIELDAAMVFGEALKALPEALLEQHNVLPLMLAEGWLTIATTRAGDLVFLDELARESGCRIQPVIARAENIRSVRHECLVSHGGADSSPGDLDALLARACHDDLELVETREPEADMDLEAAATDSPVVALVNHIVHQGVRLGCSDIHIEPYTDQFRVRYRVDGQLVDALRPSARLLPAVVSRIKIMAGLDISERRLPQDGGMSVLLGKRGVDLRVSTMTARHGEKVVMRLVDRDAKAQGLDHLGIEPAMLQRYRHAIQQPHGLILVTGPTGSGKTTTLYASLLEIMGAAANISTIEDPVERRLVGINQFQVDIAAGFTFARALRSMLRQDPDVVMVGEIRDTETARLACEAALTGHLVLSTLHTNDAATAIPRLAGMGVEPYLVAAGVRAVLAQRLVRRLCDRCQSPSSMPPAALEAIKAHGHDPDAHGSAYASSGCTACGHSGYKGRVGLYELLLVDEALLSRLGDRASPVTLRAHATARGLPTMFDDALAKCERGLVSPASLIACASAAHHDDSDHTHHETVPGA